MRLQGGLSVERMCQLAAVSRTGFYRYLARVLPLRRNLEQVPKFQPESERGVRPPTLRSCETRKPTTNPSLQICKERHKINNKIGR